MSKIDAPRHQLIYRLLTRRPDAISEVSVVLWEKLADQLIILIGKGGFDSLYTRSLHMCSNQFPRLISTPTSPQPSSRSLALKSSLADHDAYKAIDASVALLTTFVDILAMLIGEILTTSILQSAWGDDVLDTAAKDLDNE